MVQIHVEPLPITLIKNKNHTKAKKDRVKKKFCRDSTSEKSDLYELKMALFDNGKPEELFLFVKNFKKWSRLQDCELPAQIYSIFIQYYVIKR